MKTTRYDFSGEIYVSNSNMPRSLYIHQQEAIKQLTIQKNKKPVLKTLLVIPTGGGKTFTSVYWVLKEMINNNKKVLWLAHRHELLNQTLKTTKNSAYKDVLKNTEKFSYRIISGSSEHDRPCNIKEEDDFIIASKDSLNKGKQYLKKWLDYNKDNVCLVIDEAHHATAKTYRNIINMVEESSKNNLIVLGLTATPTRTSESEKGLLGKIFCDGISYSIDLKTLINNGILSKPEFIDLKTDFKINRDLTSYELTAIKKFQNMPDSISKEIALNKERNNFIVNHYIDNKSKYGKCLIFAVNIDHAIALNAIFNDRGIKSDFVVSSIQDGKNNINISAEENETKILAFRNDETDVLINVNILTEGTDIPNVETVFLTRQTTSEILLNQMIGRALRGKTAGGTENAYVVSFIDNWKNKINWVSPKNLLNYGEFSEKQSYYKKTLGNTLIPVKMIEEFAKLMDSTVKNKFMGQDYMKVVPIGSYCFNVFDEENDTDKRCEVLVFDNLKSAYEQLMEDLDHIATKFHISEEYINEEKLDEIYNYILNEIFGGYDLDFGFNEDDVKDIVNYYNLTNEKPDFIEFKDREEFNISKLVQEILDKKIDRFEEYKYVTSKWEDKSLGWSIYFNNDENLFRSEIDREMRNRISNKKIEAPKVEVNSVKYENLSLSQIRQVDEFYWRKITNEVYEKHKDTKGYYFSATGKFRSKNKSDFQIDHIIPMSKGGLTKLDNLQLLTKYENLIKSDDIDKLLDLLNEAISNNKPSEVSQIGKILIENTNNEILILNTKAKIKLFEGYFSSATKYVNQVLKIDNENYEALFTKANIYKAKEIYRKAIEMYNYILKRVDVTYEVLRNKGECYYKMKQYSISLDCYKNAYELNPNSYEANFKLASIYSTNRFYNESIKYYKEAYKINSKSSLCLNNIGVNYFKLKDYSNAIKYYDKALKLDSNNKMYLKNKNDALKKL